MAAPRDIRRCALQALYQLDVTEGADRETVRRSLDGSPGGAVAQRRGFELAIAVWERRGEADTAISAVADDWPVYRQPIIDRSILRLAFYELATERTPPKVVIDEAIELAREFSTEKSPQFINGVLDQIHHSMHETNATAVDGGGDAAPGDA